MISGFQNHLHLLYGLPGGWLDNSDILARGAYSKRKRRSEEELLEEEIAAQLLKKRQQNVVIPPEVNKVTLAAILKDKLSVPAAAGEVAGENRKKKIKMLLFALLMDD